jgi:hypothetical protein
MALWVKEKSVYICVLAYVCVGEMVQKEDVKKMLDVMEIWKFRKEGFVHLWSCLYI